MSAGCTHHQLEFITVGLIFKPTRRLRWYGCRGCGYVFYMDEDTRREPEDAILDALFTLGASDEVARLIREFGISCRVKK